MKTYLFSTGLMVTFLSACGGSGYKFNQDIEVLSQASNDVSIVRGEFEFHPHDSQGNRQLDDQGNEISYILNTAILTDSPNFANSYITKTWTRHNSRLSDNYVLPFEQEFEFENNSTVNYGLINYDNIYNKEGYVKFGNIVMASTDGEYAGNSFFFIEGHEFQNVPESKLDFSGAIIFNEKLDGVWHHTNGKFDMSIDIDHSVGTLNGTSYNGIYEVSARNIHYDVDKNLLSSDSALIGETGINIDEANLIGMLFGETGTLVGGFIHTDIENTDHAYVAQFAGER